MKEDKGSAYEDRRFDLNIHPIITETQCTKAREV